MFNFWFFFSFYAATNISVFAAFQGRRPGYFSFLDPFSPGVWLFMLLAYLAVSCVLFLVARYWEFDLYRGGGDKGTRVEQSVQRLEKKKSCLGDTQSRKQVSVPSLLLSFWGWSSTPQGTKLLYPPSCGLLDPHCHLLASESTDGNTAEACSVGWIDWKRANYSKQQAAEFL